MHTLVLLRHGQSFWNLENRFTGWTDVDLSPNGEAEAKEAARLLKEADLTFDVCYTSVLKRAIRTLNIVQENLDLLWLPVVRSWKLNERHYGALQGLNKSETAARYSEEQVFAWRRSFDTPPPALETSDERFPGHDRRYANVPAEQLPLFETLKLTVDRVLPFWNKTIVPEIQSGKRVLITAHGNSLRSLVMHLDSMTEDAITELDIPTGLPLVYELDEKLAPIRHYYLGDPEEAERKAQEVAAQGRAK